MRHMWVWIAALAIGAGAPVWAEGSLSAVVGVTDTFDEDMSELQQTGGFLSAVLTQSFWRVEADGSDASTSLGIEVGVSGSRSPTRIDDLDIRILEAYVGLRLTTRPQNASFAPYLGFGLSLLNMEFDIPGANIDDNGRGLYVRAGAEWAIADSPLFVGFDFRYRFATDFDDFESGIGDGYQTGVSVGVRW